MKPIPFTKMQAIGNDLVLVDARKLPHRQWAKLARATSDRHFGIGSDGLLVVLPSRRADARMRMFNPDGSEDFCGNGTRCVGIYLYEHGGLRKETLTLETLAGVKTLRVRTRRGHARAVTVNMGPPIFEPARLPARIRRQPILRHPVRIGGRTYRLTCLSMGTPHAVIFAPRLPSDERLSAVSPQIECHRLFPERISVIWAVAEGRKRLRIRIWERAVGESLACGTGACAALVAARLLDLTEASADVASKGGTLHVRWDGDVFKTGPAHEVYQGTWPVSGSHRVHY